MGFSLVFIFAVTMYFLVTESTNQLKADLNRESTSFASLATTPIGNAFLLYRDSGTALISQQINNYLSLDSDVTSVSVASINGEVRYTSAANASASSIPAAEASTFQPKYDYSSAGYINQIIEPLIEANGIHQYDIVYQVSSSRVEQNVAGVVRLILLIGLGVLILSIVGTAFLLNRLFIRPLGALSRSAEIISKGNYDEQIVSKTSDEIGSLAKALNSMAGSLKGDIAKLQDLDRMKTEFMMVTSHNLRTPLTVIRGYIELAGQEKDADQLKKIINTISESVTRLHLLAENMLTISTLEAGSVMQKEPTPMATFLDSIGNEFGPIAQAKGLDWQFSNQVDPQLTLSVSQANLRGALSGVIDNAIKFTDVGGSVSVVSSVSSGQLSFIVQDTGIGISSDELTKLFTKFHRGTDTMHYSYEGVGIGLYLSKLIIDQHGGTIKFASQIGQGTTCTINLPANQGQPK